MSFGCPVQDCLVIKDTMEEIKEHFLTHCNYETWACPFGCEHDEVDSFTHFMKQALIEFTDNRSGAAEDGYSHLQHCVAFGMIDPFVEAVPSWCRWIANPRREEILRPQNELQNIREQVLEEIRTHRNE